MPPSLKTSLEVSGWRRRVSWWIIHPLCLCFVFEFKPGDSVFLISHLRATAAARRHSTKLGCSARCQGWRSRGRKSSTRPSASLAP
eukprot:scaffold25512_cov90-Isochrysis_galbana.AAC.1